MIHVVHKSGTEKTNYTTLRAGSFSSGGAAFDLSLPSGSWKSRLNVDFGRQGYKDARTSYVRGHASYRGARGEENSRTWVTADLNWLKQDPASPFPREGAALSTKIPLDANYNPAGAFQDETRFTGAFGTERALRGKAQWSLTGSYSHAGISQFRGFLADISDTPGNANGFRETIDIHDIYADTHVAWPERSGVRFVAGGDFLFGNGEGRGARFAYFAPLAATSAQRVARGTCSRPACSSRPTAACSARSS